VLRGQPASDSYKITKDSVSRYSCLMGELLGQERARRYKHQQAEYLSSLSAGERPFPNIGPLEFQPHELSGAGRGLQLQPASCTNCQPHVAGRQPSSDLRSAVLDLAGCQTEARRDSRAGHLLLR
jgi:hypothetical protein